MFNACTFDKHVLPICRQQVRFLCSFLSGSFFNRSLHIFLFIGTVGQKIKDEWFRIEEECRL
jgi:hypothetical protein